MFQVIATTTRKRNTTQDWDLRIKNEKLEFSQTFFALQNLQNNELTFGKSNDVYLLLVSPTGQFYKKTQRGENKSRTFSNPTLIQHLNTTGNTAFKLEVFEKDANGTYFKFVPLINVDAENEYYSETSPQEETVEQGLPF
jgi:hypothetical protein